MKFIAKFELLLITLWLGAACFFSFGVAPSAFGILPSRELAGGMVNRTLTIINFSGLVIAILLIISSFIPRGEARQIWAWIQRLLLLVIAGACGAGQLIIGFYLNQLRYMIGKPIDQLAANDPLKLQFDTWHQYSIWALMTGMIAAFLVFFVISRTKTDSGKSSKSDIIPDFEFPDELKM
ncbi:MAG: DUF4149 domain-containing protein [Acidobacteria bacterium]|nr:DUF4149 domain-containing protein [Acidobacteriota bacterium]